MPFALALPGWGTSTDRMRPICAALADRGVDARPWGYRPRDSIRVLGAELAAEVGDRGGAVHLVGHSLGGLVAASAVLHHGAPVTTVTTINAPWRGTWAAWTAHPGDPLGRELRWGSPALTELRELLADHLDRDDGPRWAVLAAAGDLAVPVTGATRVPDGERIRTRIVPANGHSVSLLHPRMVDAVAAHVTGVAA